MSIVKTKKIIANDFTRLLFFSVCSKFGGRNLTVGRAPFPVDDDDGVVVVVVVDDDVAVVEGDVVDALLGEEKLAQVAPLLDC